MKKLFILGMTIISLCFVSISEAALSAAILWECRQGATANNVNGGGFKVGAAGTDYSQQNAAQYALTTATTAAADAIILDASAAAVMVGNIAHVISGTNFTPGWYEIVSVVVGESITVDRNCTTAAGASGVINIGGAMSLNSTLDDDFFEQCVAGNTVYIQYNASSFSLGEGVNVLKDGTAAAPITIEGYNTTRGDNPILANRPTIAAGANWFIFDDYWIIRNFILTSSETSGVRVDFRGSIENCKITNTGAGAAVTLNDDCARIIRSEIICAGGTGIKIPLGANGTRILSCYIHDSTTGVNTGADTAVFVGNIIDTCTTGIIVYSGQCILNNTIYNCTTGISGSTHNSLLVVNNIITNCTTGASWTTEQKSNLFDYNCWNNTTDVSKVTKGDNDITGDPLLTDPANGDFTLQAGSPCLNAGMAVGVNEGATGNYKWNIGADQDDVTAGGTDIFGVIW